MKYRKLGNTDMNVSAIGLGGASLGGVYQKTDDRSAIQTVHKALELGVNFIDVAPYYGITRAETVLGKALQDPNCPLARNRYYVATKVGRYGTDEFDFSAKRVTQSVHESLDRLGLDYIDLIQCHDIEFTNLDQIVNETLPALMKLKDEGKVKYIGITGFPLNIFRGVLERLDQSHKSGIVDTVLSYCHYSLNNTTLQDEFPYLKDHGVGIINASSLSMGLLTRHGAPAWHPAPQDIKDACAGAVQYVTSKGEEIERLAMQFSLANDNIHTTLVGTASIDEVTKNIAWAEEFFERGFSKHDKELIHEVQEILKPIQGKSWMSGKPENN